MILDHVAYAEDVLIGFIAALYESELDLPAEGKVEEVAASFIRGLPETSDDDARATTRDAKFWTLERRRQSAEEKIHALACPVLAMPTRAAATLEEAVAQASGHAADALESWLWRAATPYAPTLHAHALTVGDSAVAGQGSGGRRDRGKNKKKKKEGNAEVLERLERLATATPPDAEPGAPIAPVHTNVTLTKADGSVHSQCKLQVNHLETATFVDDPNLKKALVRSPPLPTPPTPLLCLSDTPSYTPTQNAVMKPVYADEKEQKMRTFYWGTTSHMLKRLCPHDTKQHGAHLLVGSGHTKTLHSLGFYFSTVVVDIWACGTTSAQVEAAAIKVCPSLCLVVCVSLTVSLTANLRRTNTRSGTMGAQLRALRSTSTGCPFRVSHLASVSSLSSVSTVSCIMYHVSCLT